MAHASSLRLYRNIESLDMPEREYWKAHVTKREHLKREYPHGIPMHVLFPSGIFDAKEFKGSYAIDGQGTIFIASPEIKATSMPGPQEIPFPWYLLFLESEHYLTGMGAALHSLERGCMMIKHALDQCRFSLIEEESVVYFLQHCQPGTIAGLASYLASEDDVGFVELCYSDLSLGADPIIAARILEDKRMLLFPRQILAGLTALLEGSQSIAEELLEEVCLIHRYLGESKMQEKTRAKPVQ
ncbi:MAG: hypothetical protein LBC99_07085 [Spirochaetota bacterium]|nr:hypothetical protein [Spirochaetota bacterium]